MEAAPNGPRALALRLNRVALLTVAVVALAVYVLGWALGHFTGAPLHPGLDGMKANTALGLLALAAGAILLRDAAPPRRARWTGRALAVFVVLLGLATAAQDVFRVDLRIDTALFPDPEGVLTPGAPGRMSPLTAVALTLAGISLLLLHRSGRIAVAVREGAASLTTALPLFVIASHVYGSPVFETTTDMSMSTRAALVAFGIALLTLRPEQGRSARFWGDTPGAYVERRLIPITVLGILMLGWFATVAENAGIDDAVTTAFLAMSLIVATVFIVDGSTRSLDRGETRRREAEAAAAEAREHLVLAVAEQRLYNAKLQFVNRAAHELNTPLTPVRVQVELLSSGRLGELNEAQQRSIRQLARNVDRLVHKVRQILDAANTRDRTPNLQPRAVSLARLVPAVVDSYRLVARNARTAIQTYLPDDAKVVVAGDPERLELALSNLVVNAIEATPEGGRIDVRLTAGEDEARIEVQDTGKGLTEPEISRLFRPFTDLAEAESALPSDGGMGMGLYTARRIAEAHGGTIRCASPGPGEGATFTMVLPLAQPVTAVEATEPRQNSADSVPRVPPAIGLSR